MSFKTDIPQGKKKNKIMKMIQSNMKKEKISKSTKLHDNVMKVSILSNNRSYLFLFGVTMIKDSPKTQQ